MTKRMSRRAALRGLGVAVGLPWLEAMSPLRSWAQEGAKRLPTRLAFLYFPNGAVMHEWSPEAEGREFGLPPTLAPLEPVRDEILVLSGLNGRLGETGPNGHPLASAPWLSTAPVGQKKDRSGFCTEITVDQLAAQKIGLETRLPSLELGCDRRSENPHVGCISWRSNGAPSGKEISPRRAFTRLFGDAKGRAYERSILDYVQEDARGLRRQLGAGDRERVEEYLEGVRAIEKRIQAIERENAKAAPPKADIPDAIPAEFPEHLKLLLEVLVLAFQTDATRVATFILDSEGSNRSFPSLGVKEGHHDLTHWPVKSGDFYHPGGEGDEWMKKIARIDRFYVEQFARLVGRLKTVREGDGTLLDHCLIACGSGLSWGGIHVRTDLPMLLAGKGGGTVAPGRHVRFAKGTPLANLWLSVLDRAGVTIERIADSTGRLGQLTG